MPPMKRKRPSPVKRRATIAGARTPGADRVTESGSEAEIELGTAELGTAEPSSTRLGSAVALLKRPLSTKPSTPAQPDDADRPGSVSLRRPRLVPIMLGLAALLLVVAVILAAAAFFGHTNQAGDGAGSANAAQIDAPATQQAGAATVDVLQKAYSYTYTTIDADLNAAVAVMTPEMGAKHKTNFDTIRKTVTNAKTTTKATVVSDAVRLLSGDRAEVLAFVVVTGDNGGTALQPSGYRFTASFLKVDGKWLLSDLTEA